MKAICRSLMGLVLTGGLISCEQDRIYPESFYSCDAVETVELHPKRHDFEALVQELVSSGVPGIQCTVYDQKNGYWSSAAGYADLASAIPLQPCNKTRVGSTVKTFTATTILLLQEEGLLRMDDPIADYLSAKDLEGIENAGEATICQLLQHSSGIYNYIQNLHFQTASLNDLTKTWSPAELLSYARGEKAYFLPGTDVLYSNTNYILLGMIIEKVAGKPFYQVFEEKIFGPLSLRYTSFAATDPVPDGIIRGYVDLYSNFNLMEATYYSGWDYYTADGGLISNAYDLNVFLTNLFEGNLLSEVSLSEMKNWMGPTEGSGDGFETSYGLGIFKIETDFGEAYLHSGDAIGYYASMVYFPEQGVTITWAVNANYGKIDEFTQSKEAMEKIFHAILE